MGGEQDETPAVQEELPPGTEDLSDPAKVKIQFQVLQKILTFWTSCLQGLSQACRYSRCWCFSFEWSQAGRSFHAVPESNTWFHSPWCFELYSETPFHLNKLLWMCISAWICNQRVMLHVISQHSDECLVSSCREWQKLKTCATKWSRFGRKCSTTTNMKSASDGPLKKGYVPWFKTCFFTICFIFNSSNKMFETVTDQEAVLPCESPGEDAAEQLEGVSGLWDWAGPGGARAGPLWKMPDRLRSLRGVLAQGSWVFVLGVTFRYFPCTSPIHDDNHIETVNVLHSLCV